MTILPPVRGTVDGPIPPVEYTQDKKEAPPSFIVHKRRKPKNIQGEALMFLGMCLNALDAAGVDNLGTVRLAMPKLFRNYCKNTGLRGKQKDAIWNQVKLLFEDAKSASASSI